MLKRVATLALVLGLGTFVHAENIDQPLAADNAKAVETAPADAQVEETGSENTADSSDVGPFIGLEGSAIFAMQADTVSDSMHSGSGGTLGLRLGAQNEEWRTMAILTRFNSEEDKQKYWRAFVQLDYFFLGNDNFAVDSFALRPYLGLSGGWINYDGGSGDSINSLTYGGQAGVTMNLVQNVDLDFGLRYNLSTSSQIDHISGATVGIQYKY